MTGRRALGILTGRPARGLALFALFVLPWPGLGPAYCGFIGGWAAATLGDPGSSVTLRFTPGPAASPPGQPWGLRVHAEDAVTGRFVGTALDLRRAGYMQSAAFAALVLVTKLRWSRRLAILFGGLATLQLLPLLPLLSFFSGKLPVQAFHFGAIAAAMVDIAYHALVAPPGMAFALPAMLWLVLVWWADPTALAWLRAAGRRLATARLGTD
jgi:hypothetical protein